MSGKQRLHPWALIRMEESKNREQLERKIARYKALARQVDDEAALRIEELVRELEQQLHSQQ